MEGSICTYSFIPVRKTADERSELTTQILFGETYTILKKEKKWAYIKVDFDNYEGWIDAKLIEPISENEYKSWKNGEAIIVANARTPIIKDGAITPTFISMGSKIVITENSNTFFIGKHEFFIPGNKPFHKTEGFRESAINLVNTTYLWGGVTCFGIDCSGLSQTVFKVNGIKLPRDASEQIKLGEEVQFVEEAKSGDLAFFEDEEGKICHVGVCIGRGEIIHASGEVRIDQLDHKGIFVRKENRYSHKLSIIKRMTKK